MITTIQKLRALALAGVLVGLSACTGESPSGSSDHRIASENGVDLTAPAVSAWSDKSALAGGIGQAPVTSQSSSHRLHFRGVRPSIAR